MPLEATRLDNDAPVELRQISTGGMVVEGLDALEPGSAYNVRLLVHGHPPMTLEGHIVYSHAPLAVNASGSVRFVSAVAFDRVSTTDADGLAAIVTALAPADEAGGESS